MRKLLLQTILISLFMISSAFADETKTVKVLTIGNSFANNSLVYLTEIVESVPGHEIVSRRANLPGASLQEHADNIKAFEDDPTITPYGNNNFSLKELLLVNEWDVITIQQVSSLSFDEESFYPYVDEIVTYIQEHAPQAEVVIHQTWAYAPDSQRLQNWDMTQDEMHSGLTEAYNALSHHFQLRQIKSGEAFYRSFEAHPEIDLWHETDRFHANLNGSYLAGLIWFSELFGTSPAEVTFIPDEIDPETVEKLQQIALDDMQDKEISILFIGNSFTFRHELPDLVKEVFEEGQPVMTVNVKRITYGGRSLFDHYTYYYSKTFIEGPTIADATIEDRRDAIAALRDLEEPPEEFADFWINIRGREEDNLPDPAFPNHMINSAENAHQDLLDTNSADRPHWDYIVLQSWQDDVADLDAGYAKYARLFAEIAEQQGSEIILYFTAPTIQNHPAISPLSEPSNPEDVERTVKLAIDLVRELQPRAVVHVPLAINRIQQGGTNLTFRYDNDFHPNQRTSFLTANLFYAAFFGESTEGFSFNTVTETKTDGELPNLLDPDGNPATVVFEGEEKSYLQQMAFDASITFNQLLSEETAWFWSKTWGNWVFAPEQGSLEQGDWFYVLRP